MELVVRLSPGSEPVVEIHAANLSELDGSLRGMRAQGVWSALKGAAREFADAPLAGIEAAVAADPVAAIEQALPGAQVIVESSEPQVDLAAQAELVREHNRLATERAIARGQIEQPGEQPADIVVPKQATPKCKTCGAATTFHSATGANGRWSAYFCATGDREHTTFL